MSRLASGPQWKPHLKLDIDGRWIVKWRAPFTFPPHKEFHGLTSSPGTKYIEVFSISVHFMTQSTSRGAAARRWCYLQNEKLGFPYGGLK